MTQVRARMRREKLFSQIKINETVNIYFLRNNFLQKDSFTSKCLQHKYIYVIVLSYVSTIQISGQPVIRKYNEVEFYYNLILVFYICVSEKKYDQFLNR